METNSSSVALVFVGGLVGQSSRRNLDGSWAVALALCDSSEAERRARRGVCRPRPRGGGSPVRRWLRRSHFASWVQRPADSLGATQPSAPRDPARCGVKKRSQRRRSDPSRVGRVTVQARPPKPSCDATLCGRCRRDPTAPPTKTRRPALLTGRSLGPRRQGTDQRPDERIEEMNLRATVCPAPCPFAT